MLSDAVCFPEHGVEPAHLQRRVLVRDDGDRLVVGLVSNSTPR
jgi:hypothetical protein